MDLKLAGKTAIVTGSGSTIGRGMALAFAREGANVVIAEIDEAQGQKVANEANSLDGKAMVFQTDVTDFESVTAMVNKTLIEFEKVDILVNNVGWYKYQLFKDKPRADWEKEIDLTLRSVLNCTKAVVDHMAERRYGKIINISSGAGRMGLSAMPIYSASKGGVIGLSRALARELAEYNINLNVICPGIIVPEDKEHYNELSMWQVFISYIDDTKRILEGQAGAIPLSRMGVPQDVANLALFLASDVSSYMTGQTLNIDGGWSMI